MRISIKTTLVSLFCLMSLMVAVLCSGALINAYRSFTAAQSVSLYASIERNLFQALSVFRYERGGSVSALSLPNGDNPAGLKQLAERRERVTLALNAALAGADADIDPALKPLFEQLRRGYEQLKILRQQIDEQLARPREQRDTRIAQRMLTEGAGLLATLEEASTAVEAQIRSIDPALSQLILARAMAWATRAEVGSGNLMLNEVVGEGRPLNEQEWKTLLINNGRFTFSWATVREIGLAPNAPPALKAAVDAAQNAFFSGPYKTLRDEVIANVSNGRPAGIALQAWRDRSEPGQTAIANVAAAAVDAIAVRATLAEAEAERQLAGYGLVLLAAVALAVAGLVVVLRRVTGPLSRLTGVMTQVSGGDLTINVPYIARTDEVGAIAKALMVFRESLTRTRALEEAAEHNRQVADEERRRAMNDLAARFENAVGGIIGNVSSASAELHQTAQQMTVAADKTSSRSTAVAAAAEEASTNVVMVASSAEELGSSVDEIARRVEYSAQMSASAVDEAAKTGDVIRELSQAASRIGDFIVLISNIASQTNLLALNATIEAARAGDAGKGFAVVASEVKALATQTAKATEEIEAQITAIQDSTQEAVKVIERVGTQIRKMSDVANEISAAVEEQGMATKEIVRNVDQAATGTNSVTSHISDVAKTADETGSAAVLVLSASAALTDQAARLEGEMQRFLGTIRAAA
ncbi:MAG TPA: HAMP domain-containing methyl-accepting chemotaxis protein [Xanthobacteraceae bacterium]|jgi:methyl-accepting chemotaxis protein|nr:HAMP domain-containing methyl-accepting chemotaxis protein [Xanthobacteraceae bacterium]HQS45823.1 HAMP domain-containing methyl-accepting chemotaxis protein [Xanthobacteraceae bacterium]